MTRHKIKTCHRTNGTFGFAQNKSRPFAKPKELFTANVPTEINKFEN
jgi:hypothetical protein